MTGQEHFAEAELYLEYAKDSQDSEHERFCLAVADVHATLALVAATLETKPQP